MGTGPCCAGCPLEKSGAGFTSVEVGARYQQTRLLLVGEASGAAEAQEGLPFRPYAQSGSLLADALREVGMSRADVAISNVVRCRPPKDWLEGAPYAFGAISHCEREYLRGEIERLKPRVILALGGTAMRALTESGRGKAFQLEYIRGFARPGAGVAEGVTVVSTFHPAFIRRGSPHLTPLLQRDLRRAFLMATGKLREGEHYSLDPFALGLGYQTAPTLDEAWEFAHSLTDASIAFDLETPMSTRSDEDERTAFTDRDIKLAQFCQTKGEGIALPWREEYVDVARYIFSLPNVKVGFNCYNFDVPVLQANGVEVRGLIDDAMVMFHSVEPDLPANLQTVAQWCGWGWPWKHYSGENLEWYGVADVDATRHSYEVLKTYMGRERA